MKKYYSFLAFALLFLYSKNTSYAQIVGTDCFLQGKFLEVGINAQSGMGTCTSPASYHVHGPVYAMTPTLSPGSNMDASYDWGHDGWTIGSPACMGGYTQPGTPQEGWSLQVGATEYRNGGWGSLCTGPFGIPGTHTGYTNTGGSAIDYWKGNIAGLEVRQQTRVDTYASWNVITTVLRNTTGSAITGVWYERTCDPDNSSYWGGGSTTRNTIVHQNEDVRHLVQVSTNSETGIFNATNSYLGYVAKDCRARCGVISGLIPGSTPSVLWTNTSTVTSPVVLGTLGTNNLADEGIYIVFNIGTIAAFDSAVISYAYIYDGNSSMDSALPDPQIMLNGVPMPVVAVPLPNHDSFDVCLHPGMTSFPVDLLHADEKNWAGSHWTWAPATGLAATTGVHNMINTLALPSVITYTITGTDSSLGNLASCENKTFYLTVHTCNGPCEGDTLWLNDPGDSLGAVYAWSGPAPSTTVFSTIQRPFKFPATMADGGVYRVIRTLPPNIDTNYFTITIQPKPNVTASSNAPLCIGSASTLSLTATSSITTGVTYTWTATTTPPFSSTVQNPTIPLFTIGDTGWYRVIVETPSGCKDTDRTHVILAAIPDPPVVTAHTPYCQFDSFIPFVVAPSSLVPGGVPLWYVSSTGGVGSTTYPVVSTSIPGVTTIWFSQTIGSCEGARDSVQVRVNPAPAPIAGGTDVCQNFDITLTDPTAGGVWSTGTPSLATVDAGGTVHGVGGGTPTVTYTLPVTGCYRTIPVNVHPKPAPPTIPSVKYCQYKLAVPLAATGTNLVYYGLGVTPGMVLAPTPSTDVPGVYNYYVTQTSDFGCISDSALFPVTIVPEPAPPVVFDTSFCQGFTAPALTATGTNLLWYATSTSTAGTATAPVPTTTNTGVLSYFVTQTVSQCESHKAQIDVNTLYLPQFTISGQDWVCQYDSINLSYNGPALVDPAYRWTIPYGSSFVNSTDANSQNVMVKFDTTWGLHRIFLTASDYHGRCFTTDSFQVKVVAAPDATSYISPNVCLGDTVNLSLSHASSGAVVFNWYVDSNPLFSSGTVNLISHNSNSGGPFLVSWNDSGRHVIRIDGFTTEGCKAIPTNDTVDVHVLPNATYSVVKASAKLCVEDSVQFVANKQDYANSYKWEPERFFDNNNKPVIWGKLEQSNSVVKLTVTDPFGCASSYSQQINPDVCCTVWFPNAFTPGALTNNMFHPVFAGFHRFHEFRVTNRWGQTIFQSANSDPEWNGTLNGVPQDVGTYYYYIKYDCGGKVIEQKGDITLVR